MDSLMAHAKKAWVIALAAFVAGILAYAPIINAKFVWDDTIVQMYQVPLIKTPGDAFFPPQGIPQWATNYYRPVVVLSYMAELKLNTTFMGTPHNPKWPMIPHLITLGAHAASSALVAFLAFKLLKGRKNFEFGALAAGVIFALHPVHAETVVFISGRSDSMSTAFLLGAILAALKAREKFKPIYLISSAILFLFALLSKEVAIAGLALLPALYYILDDGPKSETKTNIWFIPVTWAIGAIIYAMLRLSAGVNTYSTSPDIADMPWRFLSALGFYVKEAFYPWYLSPYIPELPGVFSTIAALAVLGAIVYASWRLYKNGNNLGAFCVFWFLAALFPSLVLSVRAFSETPVAERYIYLPSVAFAMGFGALAAYALQTRLKQATIAVFAIISIIYGYTSFATSINWKDDLSLWTQLTGNPQIARYALPWNNLANYYQKFSMHDNAEEAFTRAVNAEVRPSVKSLAVAQNGLGTVYYSKAKAAFDNRDYILCQKLLRVSEDHLKKAAATGFPDWTIYKNLAKTRIQIAMMARAGTGQDIPGLFESIMEDLRNAEAINPTNNETQQMRRDFLDYLNKKPLLPQR